MNDATSQLLYFYRGERQGRRAGAGPVLETIERALRSGQAKVIEAG